MGVPKAFSIVAPPKKGQEQAAVALVRLINKESIPKRLLLGDNGPTQLTIGRHDDNEVVLPLRSASKVHCQVALRPFQVPGNDESHEAAFLRDNSRNGTLVNGEPAFKPWHWLQHGDQIGLRDLRGNSEGVVNFFKVEYCNHRKLSSDAVTWEDLEESSNAPPAKSEAPVAPAAVSVIVASTHRAPRSSSRLVSAKAKRGSAFGKEICGRVVDVHYPATDEDPAQTFRMRVMSFEVKTCWHNCDSEGLSVWDGESFDDTIDLNKMYSEGNIKFVDEAKAPDEAGGESAADEASPSKKKKGIS